MMRFQPMSDYVLIAPPKQKEKTDGGLFIPQQALDSNKPQVGSVLAVGPGRTTESGDVLPMYVEKGQTVLFGAYSGVEQEIQGQKCLIMRQEDILLIQVEEEVDDSASNDVLDGATVG